MKINCIFLDLDGVNADFNGGVKKLTGGFPHEISKGTMWKAIGRSKTFFEDLDLLPDALELFAYVKSTGLPLTFLTGLPSMNDGADQKRRWVAKNLCDVTAVLVIPSKNKYLHSGTGKILIDDREDMIVSWRNAGGIGILHTTTVTTIAALKELGL